MSDRKSNPRIALVIGSGGLKCAAAIGVMQVLEEENIPLDLVVGCSGGAVFGAAIAMGQTADEIQESQKIGWTTNIAKNLNLSGLMKMIAPGLVKFDDKISVFDDEIMIDNLAKVFGRETIFSDTKIPFRCVATDFNTGEPVIITDGNLVRAIRMSSGIPLVFSPMEWNGRLLMDGGLSNPLPIDIAIQEGADIIIAVGFETPLVSSVSTPGYFAAQMFYILVNQLLYKKFAFYNLAYHSEIITIVPEFNREIGLNDVGIVPFIIEQGRMEAFKHVNYLKRLRDADN